MMLDGRKITGRNVAAIYEALKATIMDAEHQDDRAFRNYISSYVGVYLLDRDDEETIINMLISSGFLKEAA